MRPVQLALWIVLLDRCLAKSPVVTSQKGLDPIADFIENSHTIQSKITTR